MKSFPDGNEAWLGARAIPVVVVLSSRDGCLSWSLASEGRPGKIQAAEKYENCQAWLSGCGASNDTWSDEETYDCTK